ncbi:MAG: hypothetical protein J0L63_00880 [Anaerolineae bacterium]|nr:hypothetical protein [Anaerolineae bacterium]MBN8617425.1 hypothetical protein [Anaerolineae bacterium]
MSETAPEKPKRSDRKRTGQLSGLQIMFAAILAIGLILGLNFTSLVSAGQPLQQKYNQLKLEIERLELEQANLIQERDYVESDAYVEAWAHDEGKMVRPGERLIVPVGEPQSAQSTPQPEETVLVQTMPPQAESWQLWWSLFFDSSPPQF